MFLVVPLKDGFILKLVFKLPNKGGKASKQHMLKCNSWTIRKTWVDVHKILNQELLLCHKLLVACLGEVHKMHFIILLHWTILKLNWLKNDTILSNLNTTCVG